MASTINIKQSCLNDLKTFQTWYCCTDKLADSVIEVGLFLEPVGVAVSSMNM